MTNPSLSLSSSSNQHHHHQQQQHDDLESQRGKTLDREEGRKTTIGHEDDGDDRLPSVMMENEQLKAQIVQMRSEIERLRRRAVSAPPQKDLETGNNVNSPTAANGSPPADDLQEEMIWTDTNAHHDHHHHHQQLEPLVSTIQHRHPHHSHQPEKQQTQEEKQKTKSFQLTSSRPVRLKSKESDIVLKAGVSDTDSISDTTVIHDEDHAHVHFDDNNESFRSLLMDRAGWLVGLLVLQSCSSFILARNEDLISHHLVIVQFLTMLVGAGGNAGNQASVRVIRGLAVGSLNEWTVGPFLKKEALMAVWLSTILGTAGCLRAAIFLTPVRETVAITASLFLIVFISVGLGVLLPLGMKYVRIDPAHSSTTIQVVMDILGVTITVIVSGLILDSGLFDFLASFFIPGENNVTTPV